MNPRVSLRSIAALSAAAGLLVATQAEAHAHLVNATPAANATVAAPKTITLHFSEKLEPKFSGVELMKADGSKVAIASSVPAKDRKAIKGAVAGKLSPGSYMVMWHVVSADGHRMKGDFSFTVH
ncbi:MAG: copper homeostasis periplasmic binding protein CopC [Phenylobacterium sp.]|nr:copper homeostasis periplasmic binding protein CopC [Phenylobacterium sp.]